MSETGFLSQIKRLKKQAKNGKVQLEQTKVYPRYKSCKKCRGTLYTRDGNMCECMQDYILRNKCKKANISERYYYSNLEFYTENMEELLVYINNNRQAYTVYDFVEYLQSYIETFDNRMKDGRGFMLIGDVGCGKTGALNYVLMKLALKNRNVYYLDTNELLELISKTYEKAYTDDKCEAIKILERIKTVDLLVLDDFGSEYTKSLDWVYNIFLKLVKSRYSKNMPTLMSSNLDMSKLMGKFSADVTPRLSSVFSEAFEVLTLKNTKDMRIEKGKKSLMSKMKRELRQ